MKYVKFLPSSVVDKVTRTPTYDWVSEGFGEEAATVSAEFATAAEHYIEPITRTQVLKKFDNLAATWKYQNQAMSSIPEMIIQPPYQEIIGMGKPILPLLFEELKNKPDHWFWALASITGENPVRAEDRGNIQKMTAAWLGWAQEHGYQV